ncbi:xanthine dehydrogenase accessory protein XdhC [Taklimakanibacter lacteus]|uniref:xanthine dehydrogenase accessory protein XdhC n=1 Tax=Taklimakanibacter lacteus TaxID=2268456 RepID=UPI000E6613C0
MKVWPHVVQALEAGESCAMISVWRTEGSAPREAGARLVLTVRGFHGTIGGGALEWRALAEAQKKMARGRSLTRTAHALGPELGQCCGGRVELLTEVFDMTALEAARELANAESLGAFATESHLQSDHVLRIITAGPRQAGNIMVEHFGEERRSLYLFGAGHVGRALILALAPLPFATRWIDTRPDAFPAAMPAHVVPVAVLDPVAELGAAPSGTFLLIMTHSHALDLAIAERALRDERFPYVGLIGSASKRARFLSRLRQAGIEDERFAAFKCPIGLSGIRAKEPAIIAASAVAELLERDEMLRTGRNLPADAQTPYRMNQKKGQGG